MDAMGMGLCVAFIAFVRLPSLKVSTLLLSGLLLYDVFWVFFSQYVFNANVMVRVATRPADNPVGAMARKLHIGGAMAKNAPRYFLVILQSIKIASKKVYLFKLNIKNRFLC